MPAKEALTDGLNRLATEYEKGIKAERSAAWLRELSGWSDEDWRRAVQLIMDEEDRRAFPRIGEMKAALRLAADIRHRSSAGRINEDPYAPPNCACDKGRVLVKIPAGNGQAIGACCICDAGRIMPKIFKRYDPKSLQPVGVS
jgi:hypothetical protein